MEKGVCSVEFSSCRLPALLQPQNKKKKNNNNNKNYYYFPRFTPLACKEGWERQKRAVIEAISTLENLQWAAVIGDDVELESVLMIVHSSHGTSF